MSTKTAPQILLVGPVAPPYGGMAQQMALLEALLRQDGKRVAVFASNFRLPAWLSLFDRVAGVRTALRAALIWGKLWPQIRGAEVVHVMAASWLYFFVVVSPVIVLGRIHRKRVILNYRGGGAERFFDWFAWAVSTLFRAATVVTAPSEFLGRVIRDRFRVPVVIVPNIVNLSRFPYRERAGLRPKLIVARHLEKIYDLETVLSVFQTVQARHPDAALWIAGTGSQERHLRGLVPALGLQNLRFLGRVDHNRLGAIYDECDIFINASRLDNFPGALLEASAAGLPIISTCAGGIPFMYEHGKSALLCEPGNWRGLAEAVEEVLACPSLARKLSQEGAEVARKCEWVRVRAPLYEVYGMASESEPARIAGVT